jgi:hypothetical protein
MLPSRADTAPPRVYGSSWPIVTMVTAIVTAMGGVARVFDQAVSAQKNSAMDGFI